MTSRIGIAIFAKAPIAGFAKTRLIPHIGAAAAADLQRRMIERTVRVALASEIGPVSLWCAPDCEHELFASLAATHPIGLHAQSGSDLGGRMLNAFDILTRQGPAVLIGTDCPALEHSHLRTCASLLRRGDDAVFLPTEDGGYALVGAAKPWPVLFCAMSWDLHHVMNETRSRARQCALRISEPAVLWDIDTPNDYDRALACGLLTAPLTPTA